MSPLFDVRPRDITWLYIFLLYVPFCLLVYRRLSASLSPQSRRFAIGMLAAQVFLIIMSLAIRPRTPFQEWFWWIDGEWNLPSAVASTQLALVGFVSLITAIFARKLPGWQRLYILGLAPVFLLLGLDEFFDLRISFHNLREHYKLLGAAMAFATIFVAARSERRLWIWHICLLLGLSSMAFGGLVVDVSSKYCGAIGFIRPTGGCRETFHIEESFEILGAWLSLVALLGLYSWHVAKPSSLARRALYILPALWICLLPLASPVPNIPYRKPPDEIQSARVGFASEEFLYGYDIERQEDALLLQLYSYPWHSLDGGLGFSIHIVDQISGESVASQDIFLKRDRIFRLLGRRFVQVYVQEMEITLLPRVPINRAFWLVLTHWLEENGEYTKQKVATSDLPLLGDSQVILDELVLPKAAQAQWSRPLASFNSGMFLQAVRLPERAVAGEPLDIAFSWRSVVSGGENYIQFLHLGQLSSGIEDEAPSHIDNWFVYDQAPLGARLPTRLWYAGLADSETWQVMLPADLKPGRYSVFTGLYRERDQARAPAKQMDGAPLPDARVPLGIIAIE